MRHTLRYKQHEFALTQGEFILGRAATCQLSLDDPLVSRHHARLRVTSDAVVLEDLGSRNGVRVNGERLQGARQLEHGDQVLIGAQEIVLLEGRAATVETLVQPPSQRGNSFGLLGHLADKALGLGRGDEAERLIAAQLDALLGEVLAGRAVAPESVDRAADYAVRIAAATGNARWTDYVFRVYGAVGRACAAELVDQLYSVIRRVEKPTSQALRDYLVVLRGLELGPSERFLLSRLEGLERLIGAR